jgi:hypothetical protein
MMTFLTRQQSADYLTERGVPISTHTLQKFATTGGGPPYSIFGNKALYKPEALEAWVEERLAASRTLKSEAA